MSDEQRIAVHIAVLTISDTRDEQAINRVICLLSALESRGIRQKVHSAR